MKNIITISTLIALLIFTANAQTVVQSTPLHISNIPGTKKTPGDNDTTKMLISIGAELVPGTTSNDRQIARTGFGGSFRLESAWSNHIAGMATIGYLSFAKENYQTIFISSTTVKAFPIIQVGLKYYTEERKQRPKGFFISTELGLFPKTIHYTYFGSKPDNRSNDSEFKLAPGVGYQLGNLELGFRIQYNLSGSFYSVNYYNFRIAYAFLKKKDKDSNKNNSR